MLSEQQQRIMGYFIEEAKDHLNTIEQGLVNLQATIEDSEMVHEVFRAAHSVKGGAAMLGLDSIQLTAHRLEDYFKVLKECPQVKVDQKLETLFLRVYDTLHELVDQLQGPFGLTDDKAQEAMATVEPVFNQLGQHLNELVSRAGGVLPEDVSLAPAASVPVAQTVPSQPKPQPAIAEESAFQFIFQNDVPARLREMLQLFKQTDGTETRGQLQDLCRMLSQPGEQFDLPKWCELLSVVQRAIGNPENTYRTLAPVVIKDVKRAQELVLSGRSDEISACSDLIQLLPPETADLEDIEAVEEDNLFDLLSPDLDSYTELADASPEDLAAEANEAALLFGDPSFIEQPEPSASTDDWFSDMSSLEHAGGISEPSDHEASALEFDLGFDDAFSPDATTTSSALETDANVESLDFSFIDQIENSESLPDEIGEHSGPEVGVSELNSLADLFEGELSDLGLTWQEEEIIEQPAQVPPPLFSPENSGDFSDLLFDQDGLDALTLDEPEEDDLSGLLNAVTLPVSPNSGIEQPSPLNPNSVSIDGLVDSPQDTLSSLNLESSLDLESPLNLELPEPFVASDSDADDMAMFFFPDPPSEDNTALNEGTSLDDEAFESVPFASGVDNPSSEDMAFDSALFGDEPFGNDLSETVTSENDAPENDAAESVASTSFENLDELFAGADVGVFASDSSQPSESLESESLEFQSIFGPNDDAFNTASVEEESSPEMDLGLLFGETIDESDESNGESDALFPDDEITNETIETIETIDPFEAVFSDFSLDTSLDTDDEAIATPEETIAAELDNLDVSPWDEAEEDISAVPSTAEFNLDDETLDKLNLDEQNHTDSQIDHQIDNQTDSQEADLTFDFPDLNPVELDEVDLNADGSSIEHMETVLQEDSNIPADLDFDLDLFADEDVQPIEAISDDAPSDLDDLFEGNDTPVAAVTQDELGFDLDDLFGHSESSITSDTVTDESADLDGLLGEIDEESVFSSIDSAIDSTPDSAVDSTINLDAAFESSAFENPEFENPEFDLTSAPTDQAPNDSLLADNPFAEARELDFSEFESDQFESNNFESNDLQETELGQPPSEFEAVLASEVSLDEQLEDYEFASELGNELNSEFDGELNSESSGELTSEDEITLDFTDLDLGFGSELPDETNTEDAIEPDFGAELFESNLFESDLFEASTPEASAFEEPDSIGSEFGSEFGDPAPSEPDFVESSDAFPDFSFDLETASSEVSTNEGSEADVALDILDFDSLVVEDAALTQAEGTTIQADELDFGWETSSGEQDSLVDLDADLDLGLDDRAVQDEVTQDDEFAGLEDMLGEDLVALEPTVETSADDVDLAAAELNDFDELESMLAGDRSEPSSEPAVSYSSAESEDFSDLEALLGDEFPISSPPIPVAQNPVVASSHPISQVTTSANSDDEFGDLEALLQDADQKLGVGSSPVRSSASTAVRRPSRRNVIADQTMRVSVKHLDNLNNLVGEMVVNRNSLEQAQERLRQFLDNLLYQVQQLSDVGQRMRDLYERSLLESSLLSSRRGYQFTGGGSSSSSQSTHATGASFDALEMDRFTGFHTLSQEMIELIVRVRESASDIDFVVEESDQITRNFRQITTQLQEGLTRSRMVPFAQTADRLPRGVRDNAIKYGKQAELIIEGRDTLIDKMIVEQLYDPMTHLVNNAIAHGIETPEERIAAGKAPTGRIIIRAFHQGNQTVISVSDDGAGINPEKVRAKALAKGLINAIDAQQMSRLETYDLLFHHGFSTADQVDDLRGRGVGLDVVRNNLSEIRGVITIDSAIGKGTTFTIRLPLTLSISKALCCISNRARIAFPMDGVEDMLDVPKERIQMDEQNRPCIQWRDTLLPFQPLAELLRYNRVLGRGSVYGGNQEDDMLSVVVLRSAGNYLALQVDQVLGEQEIVIKQLEGPVPKPIGVAGATVLGDGRIMPIADVLELIDLSQGRIRREANNALWETSGDQVAQDAAAAKTEPTVLIVDDSITVRELLSMTFNKVGYRVEQARDGQEAWEKLRSGLPCDLVFCDIEMPRMDGLELLSRLQKDPTLTQIPIAMLTSRGADRHRQMAVQLGAKGYFTKPYLEEVLLDAAQRMLRGEVLVTSNAPSN